MSRRKEIHLELIKNGTTRQVVFKPIFNRSKYHVFIDGQLRYLGAGFSLRECAEKLATFERSGFTVRVLSRGLDKPRRGFSQTIRKRDHA